jgi:hypothetical protein
MATHEQQITSIKSASVDFAEGAVFGAVVFGSEELDTHMGLNSDELKSFGTGVPLAATAVGVVGALATQGRDHELFSDIIFMATPFAAYRLLRLAKAKNLFGRTFNMKNQHFAQRPQFKPQVPQSATIESSLV